MGGKKMTVTVPKNSAWVCILFLLLNSDLENTMVLQIDLTCLCLCMSWWDWTMNLVCARHAFFYRTVYTPSSWSSCALSQRFTHWAIFPGPTSWLLPQKTFLLASTTRQCRPLSHIASYMTALFCFLSSSRNYGASFGSTCLQSQNSGGEGGWVSSWKPGLHRDRRPQGKKKQLEIKYFVLVIKVIKRVGMYRNCFSLLGHDLTKKKKIVILIV